MLPADPPATSPAPAVHTLRTSTRRGRPASQRSFVISVAVALALNAVLLAALATAAERWRVSSHPQRSVTWITSVATTAPRPATPPAGLETPDFPRALAQSPPAQPARAAPREAAAAPAASPEAASVAAPARPEARDEGNPVRFYAYREVDRAAEPDSDWNLDAPLLDGAGVTSLVFEVFISATGEVVACTILRPVDLADDLRSGLEDRLRRTTLRPAMRAGVSVPSVRRIELSVQ